MIEFTTPIHKTNIVPLRLFANTCNHLSTPFLEKAFNMHYETMEENAHISFKYHFNVFMYNLIDKPYKKWGTTYEVDMDAWRASVRNDPEHQELIDRLGSDYDENGIPYWKKWDNEDN